MVQSKIFLYNYDVKLGVIKKKSKFKENLLQLIPIFMSTKIN